MCTFGILSVHIPRSTSLNRGTQLYSALPMHVLMYVLLHVMHKILENEDEGEHINQVTESLCWNWLKSSMI